jgi:hypothetical protein
MPSKPSTRHKVGQTGLAGVLAATELGGVVKVGDSSYRRIYPGYGSPGFFRLSGSGEVETLKENGLKIEFHPTLSAGGVSVIVSITMPDWVGQEKATGIIEKELARHIKRRTWVCPRFGNEDTPEHFDILLESFSLGALEKTLAGFDSVAKGVSARFQEERKKSGLRIA